MLDKTALGISEELRQYIEAIVEDIILKGGCFEIHKKYLSCFCGTENIDYKQLESDITILIEITEELKAHKSKRSEHLIRLLGKECYLSHDKLEILISAINNKRSEDGIPDIKIDSVVLDFLTSQGVFVTKSFTITGNNLIEDVVLTLTGPDKQFTLSETIVSANAALAGVTINVTFNAPMRSGYYRAQVDISSGNLCKQISLYGSVGPELYKKYVKS